MKTSKDFKKTTPWFYSGGGKTVTRYDYGFTCFAGQAPYFSVTGEEWAAKRSGNEPVPAGRDCISCGCLHDRFPKDARFLREAVPFHLFTPEQGPMHYFENAKYRHNQASGELDGTIHDPARDPFAPKTPWELFEGSVLWGVLEGDEEWKLEAVKRVGPETLQVWLADRLVRLNEKFIEVMASIGAEDLLVEASAWHRENG